MNVDGLRQAIKIPFESRVALNIVGLQVSYGRVGITDIVLLLPNLRCVHVIRKPHALYVPLVKIGPTNRNIDCLSMEFL